MNQQPKLSLVTGVTGFLGGHLARRLLADGVRVSVLVRSAEKGAELAGMGAELLVGDLQDAALLRQGLEGVDVVYHMAALYREDPPDRREYHRVNATGTENLLAAACRNHVRRFIHCSTVGVHGTIRRPPAAEDAPLHPEDDYQRSKLAGEEAARRCFQEQSLPGVIVRPAAIYGPSDTRFLKLFRMIQRRRFPLFGGGRVLYHMTHVDDLVRGILLCSEQEAAVGKTYILAGGDPLPLRELVQIVAEELGVPPPRLAPPLWPLYAAAWACETLCRPLGLSPPLYRRRIDFFSKDRAFDTSAALRDLGYAPQVSLREGVAGTARWYREQGWIA